MQEATCLAKMNSDLSGNPENNVPEHTHLLPNPKTGKRYLVTKYGSIVYE